MKTLTMNTLHEADHTAPVVIRTRIIGTKMDVYSAWEPAPSHPAPSHSTITYDAQGRKWGRIGCNPLPAELDAIKPYSDDRIEQVSSWHAANYARAYSLIAEHLPAPCAFNQSMGEITLYGQE